ncbi:MAG: hypothetical protein ACRDBO_00275 [Lachnospiraceae bacterium]
MSFNVYDEIQKASLAQFRNQPVTNGIQRAIADALQSVYAESQQLRDLGDIDKMAGKNLDVIGERLDLSRSEAYIILRRSQSVEVTDEIYRKCLKWKQLKNNFTGTYPEIMESIRILWKTDNIIYRELPEHPAHIFISMPLFDLDIRDPWMGRALVLKPDGVAMTFTSDYSTSIDESKIESIRVPAMHMYMKVFWSKAYVFDGTLRFDGEQTFFGWTYNLPVSMAHSAVKIQNIEIIDSGFQTVVTIPMTESIDMENIEMFLGEVETTEDCSAQTAYKMEMESNADVIEGNKVVYSRNPGFFDGTYTFNGARCFDAYYKEEEY